MADDWLSGPGGPRRPIHDDQITAGSAEFLERQLTVVLAQEVQESLVVVVSEVEHARDALVIAAGVLEPSPHDLAQVALGDFALHVERVHRRPERLAFGRHAAIQLVRYGAPPLAHAPRRTVQLGAQLDR